MPTFPQQAPAYSWYLSKAFEYLSVTSFVLAAQKLMQEDYSDTNFLYALMGFAASAASAVASDITHRRETVVQLEIPFGIDPEIFRLLQEQVIEQFFQRIHEEAGNNNRFFGNNTTPEQIQAEGQALEEELRRYLQLLPSADGVLTQAREELSRLLQSEAAQTFFTDLATILANVTIRYGRNQIIQASIIAFLNQNRTREGLQEFLVAINRENAEPTITTDRVAALIHSLRNMLGGINDRLETLVPPAATATN